jgi:hypothetical protein
MHRGRDRLNRDIIMEVQLIEKTNTDSFNAECRELIEEGWKPMFSAQIYSVEGRASGNIMYTQQFWREGEKVAESRVDLAIRYLESFRGDKAISHAEKIAMRIAAGIHK